MNRAEIQSFDENKPNWGNLDANLYFLRNTGILDKPQHILEIGCGKGEMLRELATHGHQIIGIDFDPAQISQANTRNDLYPQLTIASGDALPFDSEVFDVVISFDVFEHIPDSDLHLAEVRRVLKPNGYYLLQTPNKWTNVIFETIRFSKAFGIRNAFKFLEPPEHCSLHSYRQLIRRFHQNGFEIRYHEVPVVNDFFKDKVQRFLGKPGLWLLKIINPDRFPMSLKTNFFVQTRKLNTS